MQPQFRRCRVGDHETIRTLYSHRRNNHGFSMHSKENHKVSPVYHGQRRGEKNDPNLCWNGKENQRQFMDQLGKKLGYTRMDDWYKLTKEDILHNGGSSLLEK